MQNPLITYCLLVCLFVQIPTCKPQQTPQVKSKPTSEALPTKAPEPFRIEMPDAELKQAYIKQANWTDQSPVPWERLRRVVVQHIDFQGNTQSGEIIVLDACSPQVLAIFKELYALKFPIQRMKNITNYRGSDSLSMVDNNTSSHNFRKIVNGSRISLHAYGTAIDLNPIQNPYLNKNASGKLQIEPEAGKTFAHDRAKLVDETGVAEKIVSVFAAHGFYAWGGNWKNPIDYQHFQINRPLTELLVAMPADEATDFFRTCTDYYNKHKKSMEDVLEERKKAAGMGSLTLAEVYQKHPKTWAKIKK